MVWHVFNCVYLKLGEWMNQNMLKLNDDKAELIVFTSKYKQDLYNYLSITIMFLILQRRADFIFETLAE